MFQKNKLQKYLLYQKYREILKDVRFQCDNNWIWKKIYENIEQVDKKIKKLYIKIGKKFGKLPKDCLFVSLFNKPDDIFLVNYMDKLSEKHRKTNWKIAKI